MPALNHISIGLIGLGTVGSGVYKLLSEQPSYFVKQVAVKDAKKSRSFSLAKETTLSEDPMALVKDHDINLVVEVVGGVTDARVWITEALKNKKHVVTANKALIAQYGPELFALARENNVRLLFEGAVAGGIPIILPLKLSLAGNKIEKIAGILNGTTNYILTQMTQKGQDYGDALKQAQALGFAEADPSSDVDGHDTAYKISILASLASQQYVQPDAVSREGITKITATDIQMADTLGYVVKLIGLAQPDGSDWDVRVQPMLIPKQHPLASIHNEYNAVWVKGSAVGDVMFEGKGAGEMPTASAVVGDILAIGSELLKGNDPIPLMDIHYEKNAVVKPVAETHNKYYIRLTTPDQPGVVGKLGTACGDHGISLESVLQKGTYEDGTACIVLITHQVSESSVQKALEQMKTQHSVQSVDCLIKVWH